MGGPVVQDPRRNAPGPAGAQSDISIDSQVPGEISRENQPSLDELASEFNWRGGSAEDIRTVDALRRRLDNDPPSVENRFTINLPEDLTQLLPVQRAQLQQTLDRYLGLNAEIGRNWNAATDLSPAFKELAELEGELIAKGVLEPKSVQHLSEQVVTDRDPAALTDELSRLAQPGSARLDAALIGAPELQPRGKKISQD